MSWITRAEDGNSKCPLIQPTRKPAPTPSRSTPTPAISTGSLNVPDRSEITIALVDRFGNVMWRDRGRYTETKIENLEYSIINHLANVRIYAEN